MATSNTYATLCELCLVSEATSEIFHRGTRDHQELLVYRDRVSGVIYIRDYYVGEGEYVSGDYRAVKALREGKRTSLPNFERAEDCRRRVESLRYYYCVRDIADFGCGHGDFLAMTRAFAHSSLGIELQQDLVDGLQRQGIDCVSDCEAIADVSLDTIFLFHSFEHLPNPSLILRIL
jgi:hypothetical protein